MNRTPKKSIRRAVPSHWCLGVALLTLSAGCTHYTQAKHQAETKLLAAAQVNNHAAAEALNLQPTPQRDAFTETARNFVEQNERILGAPAEPIEVRSIIAESEGPRAEEEKRQNTGRINHELGGPKGPAPDGAGDWRTKQPGINPPPAMTMPALPAQMKKLFAEQNQLLTEHRQVADKLVRLGEQKEAERNTRISFWTRLAGLVAIPAGGLVALIILVPVSVPILGRVLGWLVGRLPGLAGWIGVVSTKAFDATVQGIEKFKAIANGNPGPTVASPAPGNNNGGHQGSPADTALTPMTHPNAESVPVPGLGRAAGENAVEQLQRHLSQAMDADHKRLVKQRRAAVLEADRSDA